MTVEIFLASVGLYLAIGLCVALAFVVWVGRIDRAARGVFAFRLLLVPGVALLWPLVLVRSLRALAHGAAP